jgi:hypothetical protein
LAPATIGLDDDHGGGRDAPHAVEDGAFLGDDGMEGEVVVQRDRVDAGVDLATGDERGQGRGEAQGPGDLGQVQRLDAELVAGEHGPSRVQLDDAEGEHPEHVLDQGNAPAVVALEQHLGVARREEPVACGLELGAELTMVVDAAVEDRDQAQLGVDHGLGAAPPTGR